MPTSAEMQSLRQFAERYCAINGEDGSAPDGYFRLDAGRSVRAARKQGASVPWSTDVDSVFSELCDRVAMLVADGWPVVVVCAMYKSDSNPANKLRIDGDLLSNSSEDEESPKGGHALGEAHARVVLGLLRTVQDQAGQLQSLAAEKEERALQALGYGLHAQLLEQSDRARTVAAALEAAGPTIQAVAPMIINAMVQQGRGPAPEGPAPEEPQAAAEYHVAAIERAAQDLAAVVSAHPDALTPELVSRLALLEQVAAAAAQHERRGREGAA